MCVLPYTYITVFCCWLFSQEAARRREEEDRRARERAEEEEARCLERFMDAEPLDPKELHAFTDSMLPGCFHLLDELPDTVYRLCDLLMTAIKRNGPEYRDLILGQVVDQVSAFVRLFHVDICIHGLMHTICCHVSHQHSHLLRWRSHVDVQEMGKKNIQFGKGLP